MDTQGWSVSWVSPETGVSSKLDLDKASELPFDTGLPTRTPQAHKGQKAKPGLLWSSTTKAHLLYESRTDMSVLLDLDYNYDVLRLSTQPLRLHWKAPGGRWRVYTPNVAVRYRNNDLELLEISTLYSKQDESRATEREAASLAALTLGWSFRVVTPPSAHRLTNLMWLAGYRQPMALSAQFLDIVNSTLVKPVQLGTLIERLKSFPTARASLYGMLWRHIITVDLNKKLDDTTLVQIGPAPLPNGGFI